MVNTPKAKANYEAVRKAKESEINQRIEAIRKRNEEIQRRYEEIEKDKINEEAFSREALARMKEMAAVGASQPEQEDEQQDKNQKIQQQKPKQRKSGKKLASEPPPLQLTLTYRPQRLSEDDLPPEDPVYTYLTDRLREGALCSPISPGSRRRRRSSASSEMSWSSRSSGSQSRKVSTASNSSWTSDTSSQRSYDGFANYQPPTPQIQRKYSGTHEYIKNRRMSNAEIASGIAELRNVNERIPENQTQPKAVPKTSVAEESRSSWHTTSTTNGNGGATWKRERNTKKKNATEMVGNWRNRETDTQTIESVVNNIGNLVLTTTNQITEEDLNNNDDLNNRNISNNMCVS